MDQLNLIQQLQQQIQELQQRIEVLESKQIQILNDPEMATQLKALLTQIGYIYP